MNPYLKLFVSIVLSTLLLMLCQTLGRNGSNGYLIWATFLPPIIVIASDKGFRKMYLIGLAVVALSAIIMILAEAPLKDHTLTFWGAVLDLFIVTFLSLLLYFLCVFPVQRALANRATAKEDKRLLLAKEQAELDKFMTEAAEGRYPDLSSKIIGVMLHRGERCCASAEGVDYVVMKKKTSYVGGSQGVSFRIAKGIKYHVSAYKGRPVTTVEDVVADRGSLYVTNQRVVFAGVSKVLTFKLETIGDVRVYSDGIALLQENKQEPFVFRF